MKKRSLFVATAMLLVAVIVATSATYAWFTNVNTAKATVSMGISEGSSLEISADNKKTWVSTFELTKGMWVDASIAEGTDNKLGELYRPDYNDPDNGTVITGYHVVDARDNVISQTIHFRSTKEGNITFTKNSTIAEAKDATIDGDIMKYAQILVVDGNSKKTVYATSGGNENTINGTISGTATTDDKGSYTPVTLQGATNVVTMAKNEDTGYFEGEATFYFFIEGTKTNNFDLMGNSNGAKIVATLEFGQ